MSRLPTPGSDENAWGMVLNDFLNVAHHSDGTLKAGSISKLAVGLGSVDDTSDTNKPISLATQAALDGKQPLDSDLSAIAALSTAAYGRDLLTLANQAALAALVAEPDRVFIDSYAGASFDQKLTAAMADVSAMANIKAIQLGAGASLTSSVGGRTPYSGMRIYGMSGRGPKNPEISPLGHLVPSRIVYSGGSGLTSMFNGNGGTYYDIYFDELAIQYGTNNSFWYQNTGTLYACEFKSMTHFGPRNVFGHESGTAKLTQCVFSGHWTVLGMTDTPFHIGGSDNDFWTDGYCNLNGSPTTAGAGKFLFHLENCSKTNIGSMYITCMNGWRGIWLSGSNTYTKGLYFSGLRIEGENTGNPNPGRAALLEVGATHWRDLWLAYNMTSPDAGEQGVIEITGGDHRFDGVTWDRGTLPASSATVPYSASGAVPLFYVSAGTLIVSGISTVDGEVPYAVRTGTGKIVVLDGSLNVQDGSGLYVNANPFNTTIEYLKVLSANQTFTSTTVATAISELGIPVVAGETWLVEGEIFYAGSTAGDLKLSWTVPANTAQRWSARALADAATGVISSSSFIQTNTTDSEQAAGAITGIDTATSVKAYFKMTASGSLTLEAAQNTSDATATTVYAGSYLRFSKAA